MCTQFSWETYWHVEYQGIEGILIFKRILVEQCKREEGGTINIATNYVYIYV